MILCMAWMTALCPSEISDISYNAADKKLTILAEVENQTIIKEIICSQRDAVVFCNAVFDAAANGVKNIKIDSSLILCERCGNELTGSLSLS